ELAACERGTQRLVPRVAEQPVAEPAQRLLDALPEPLAYTPSLGDGLLEVAFEPALRRIGRAPRESRAVEEPVEDDELVVLAAVEDRGEVELDVRRPRDLRVLADELQQLAVRHDPPQVLGALQVVLQERLGASSSLTLRRAPVEVDVDAFEMDGRRVLAVPRPVRDGETRPTSLDRLTLEGEGIAEGLQPRDEPGLAG